MTLRSENRSENILGALFIIFGILMRLLPHPENMTPVTAIALFSGVVLAPRIALFLPVTIMIASDLLIGPHALYPLTWGSFFLVSLLGIALGKNAKAGRIFIGTLSGSVTFFLVTNLGVFFFQDMYEKSWQGLLQCFIMALPFFRNSLFGDLFYSALFFGVFAAIKNYSRKRVSTVSSS